MVRLNKELAFFQKERQSLLKEHDGEVVLIKGDKIIGFFADELTAYEAGVEQFGNKAFFIKKITDQDEETTYHPALTLGLIHADPQ